MSIAMYRIAETKCISKDRMCNGLKSCDDRSDELASLCDGCSSSKLFKCQKDGKEACLANKLKCDGRVHCDDAADELINNCGNCTLDQFACHDGKQCISSNYLKLQKIYISFVFFYNFVQEGGRSEMNNKIDALSLKA